MVPGRHRRRPRRLAQLRPEQRLLDVARAAVVAREEADGFRGGLGGRAGYEELREEVLRCGGGAGLELCGV